MKLERVSEEISHPSSPSTLFRTGFILHPLADPPRASPRIRRLGLADYVDTYHAMREFTARRGSETQDEIWLLEHAPVYTTGMNGKREHFPVAGTGIPVIATDRGGQITYHAPGQAVIYLLLDLRRRRLGVRTLVRIMEQSVIETLADDGIGASAVSGMPGVYVNGAKIASVGLRIARGCSYHGLALNVDMDLAPFRRINPCGYPGLRVTQTRDLGISAGVAEWGARLSSQVIATLENR